MRSKASHCAEKIVELVSRRDRDSFYIWRHLFDELSRPDQVLLAVWELYSEVHNGGLDQFFTNSSGKRTPFVPEAPRLIGMYQLVPVVEDAIALLGSGVPWDDDVKRWEIVNAMTKDDRDRLWKLDGEFGQHIEDMIVALFAYLSKHRDEMDVPADFWVEAVIQ